MSNWTTAYARLDIRTPTVAWLVHRGEMVSSKLVHENAISLWTVGHLSELSRGAASWRFALEQEIELQRQQNHPAATSRLTGFYVFADYASAMRAASGWRGFDGENVAEVAINPSSKVSHHDAEWISRGFASGGGSWIGSYLQGEPAGPDPIWELVVDGRALILGTDLRADAWEVVRRVWPRSLPLLDISRVAAELDSDVGLIAALATRLPDRVKVDYMMNFEDVDNQAFLDRLKNYEGPRNALVPEGAAPFSVPDLRSESFEFPLPPTSAEAG